MLYLIFSEEGGKKRMTPFMEWNLNCLRAIAELRTPLLDTLMQGVTELGGETLFMLFMLFRPDPYKDQKTYAKRSVQAAS